MLQRSLSWSTSHSPQPPGVGSGLDRAGGGLNPGPWSVISMRSRPGSSETYMSIGGRRAPRAGLRALGAPATGTSKSAASDQRWVTWSVAIDQPPDALREGRYRLGDREAERVELQRRGSFLAGAVAASEIFFLYERALDPDAPVALLCRRGSHVAFPPLRRARRRGRARRVPDRSGLVARTPAATARLWRPRSGQWPRRLPLRRRRRHSPCPSAP